MPRASGRAAQLAKRRPQLVGSVFTLAWQRSADSESRLMIAVPKRLARSSPLRNMIRRVVKESWRAHDPDAGLQCLIRLRALPVRDVAGDVASVTSPSARKAPSRGAARIESARLPDRQLKRACRADSDGLLRRLAGQPAGSAVGAAGDSARAPQRSGA